MTEQGVALEYPKTLLLRTTVVALILMSACSGPPEDGPRSDARTTASIVETRPVGTDMVEVTSVVQNLTDDTFEVECEIVVRTQSGESRSVKALVTDLQGASEDRMTVKIPVEDASSHYSGTSSIDCEAR